MLNAQAEALKAQGNAHFQCGRYEEAIALYKQATAIDATAPTYWSNMAACYQKLNDFDSMSKTSRRCIQADPFFIKGYFRLATAQRALKDTREAIATLDSGLAVQPYNADLLQLKQQLQQDLMHNNVNSSKKRRAMETNGGGENDVINLVDSSDDDDEKQPAAKRVALNPNASSSATAAEATEQNDATMGNSAAPIKLFANTADEAARRGSPLDPHHWSRSQCWTLREMLGFDNPSSSTSTTTLGTIEWLVIGNFLIDFVWLLDEIPELVSIPRVTVFYGDVQGDPRGIAQWKAAASSSVDFVRLDPSEPTDSPHNPCGHRIPYGVHHSKFFLVGYAGGQTTRVVIHTSNLIYSDIHVKTQAAYVQDFPLKQQQDVKSNSQLPRITSDFEEALLDYLDTYRYNKEPHVWLQGRGGEPEYLRQVLRRVDFSKALAVLIPSTPGYHRLYYNEKEDAKRRGHLALKQAVAKYTTPSSSSSSQASGKTRPIICQFSSIGSLTEKYLLELQASMDTMQVKRSGGTATAKEAKASTQLPWAMSTTSKATTSSSSSSTSSSSSSTSSLRLQLVYPSVEQIRSSVEGYRGGGAIPGNSKNLNKDFLRPLFRRWSSPPPTTANVQQQYPLLRERHSPHIKTYYQVAADGESLDYFVVTSHNLSKAAWGTIQNSTRHGGQRLFVRHWELGVFVSPQLLDCQRLVPWSPSRRPAGDCTIPLPYRLFPQPYKPTDNGPWAVDGRYIIPDAFGRRSVRDP